VLNLLKDILNNVINLLKDILDKEACMRQLIIGTILFLVISTNLLFSQEGHYLTLEQQKFADSVTRNNPEVITSSWMSEKDLLVESMNNDKEAAYKLAEKIIVQGKYIRRSFCVKIYQGDYEEIAQRCIVKDSKPI